MRGKVIGLLTSRRPKFRCARSLVASRWVCVTSFPTCFEISFSLCLHWRVPARLLRSPTELSSSSCKDEDPVLGPHPQDLIQRSSPPEGYTAKLLRQGLGFNIGIGGGHKHSALDS